MMVTGAEYRPRTGRQAKLKDSGRWHMPQKILPVQAVTPQKVAVAGRSEQTSDIISLVRIPLILQLYRDLR